MKPTPRARRLASSNAARGKACTGSRVALSGAIMVLAALACATSTRAQTRVGEIVTVAIRSPRPYPNAALGASASPGEQQLVWQQTLHYPGATFLKLRFAHFAVAGSIDGPVATGDYVVVRSADGAQRELLSGTRDEDFWTRAVQGDTAVVEIYADAVQSDDGVEIDAYGYGFAPLLSRSVCGSDESTGICDATDPQRAALADAVGRVLFASDCGGLFVCTGFLFSPEGLFMTNAHCANSARESRSMEVWLNYTQPLEEPREPDCSLPERPNPDVYRAQKLVLSDCALDVAVHQMDVREKGNPADLYGFLPLSARMPSAGEAVWVPQHASGAPKRISENGVVATPLAEGVNFCSDPPTCVGPGIPTLDLTEFGHTADTSGGSSGSPVLDAQNQVIGLHHAGGCSAGGGENTAVLMGRILALLGAAPRARLTTQPRRPVGDAPLTLSFDASASFDPDGGVIVAYELDPGDGSPIVSSSSPLLAHTYTVAGRFAAALHVVDDEGTRSKRPLIRRVRVRSPG